MGTIEQPLGGHAAEQPGQLRNLGNIRLAIEHDLVRIQSQGKPGSGDLQSGLAQGSRILALDQGMQIRQKKVRLLLFGTAAADRGPDGPDIIAQVGCTRGGDAGKNRLPSHNRALYPCMEGSVCYRI